MIENLKIINEEISVFENSFKNTVFSLEIPLKNELMDFLFSKSKRLRPIFIILFSKILKIDSEKIFDFCILSELAHNASLIHDDVIDEEEIRRNKETFNKKFGNKLAILEGDLLLSIFLEVLSNQNSHVVKIYSKNIRKTVSGEINQMLLSNKIPSFEQYYEKTFNKTGNLFLAGLEALFSLKDIDLITEEKLINFMKNYSLAFQIKNDIDNFKTNKSDYKNGNYTLPVIYLKSQDELNQDVNTALDLSENKLLEILNEALRSLEGIENSIYKEALIALSKQTLGR